MERLRYITIDLFFSVTLIGLSPSPSESLLQHVVCHRQRTTMSYAHLATPDTELAPLCAGLPPAPETYTQNLPEAREYLKNVYTPYFHSAQRKLLPPGACLTLAPHGCVGGDLTDGVRR